MRARSFGRHKFFKLRHARHALSNEKNAALEHHPTYYYYYYWQAAKPHEAACDATRISRLTISAQDWGRRRDGGAPIYNIYILPSRCQKARDAYTPSALRIHWCTTRDARGGRREVVARRRDVIYVVPSARADLARLRQTEGRAQTATASIHLSRDL